MARKEVIQYFDDFDNRPLGEKEVNIVRFSLDGVDYVIDLAAENAAKLRETFRPYIEHARRDNGSTAPRRRSGGATAADRNRNRAARKWLKENGYKVADRGKISEELLAVYNSSAAGSR